MSKEKQATYDTKAICRFVGRLLFALTGLMLIGFIGVYFEISLFKLGFAASFMIQTN